MANTIDARALGPRGREPGPSASSRCECGQNPPRVHQSMVMARALMMAILLAIGPGGRGSASANSHGRPLPSAFVASRSHPPAAKDAMMGGALPRRPPARKSALAMVLIADRDDDETFFFRASQLAAQRRKERMREGRDSLAVELSSTSGGATAVKEEEEDVKAMEGDAEGASATEEETRGESKENPFPSQDVKVPVDPFQLRQKQQQEPPVKPRGRDDFQRKLLETRLLMEENAKLARKVKELEETNESVAESMGEVDQTVMDQVAGKESAPVGSAVSEPITLDDYAALLSGIETKEEEEEKPRQESSAAQSGPRLSSDGKELFEPSPEALAVDKEKVNEGLMTLTRGLLALQSIVNREDS
ncbi:hypothetical protein ACHAXT_005547 [Thalassiosira profunda]